MAKFNIAQILEAEAKIVENIERELKRPIPFSIEETLDPEKMRQIEIFKEQNAYMVNLNPRLAAAQLVIGDAIAEFYRNNQGYSGRPRIELESSNIESAAAKLEDGKRLFAETLLVPVLAVASELGADVKLAPIYARKMQVWHFPNASETPDTYRMPEKDIEHVIWKEEAA